MSEENTNNLETHVKPNIMMAIAQRIFMGETGKHFIYSLQEDKFYVYDDGYWCQLFEIEFLTIITRAFPGINSHPIATRKQIVDNFKLLASRRIKIFNQHQHLNFPQGELDVATKELREHHPDYYSTNRIPYNYNCNAICPLWEKSLLDIFEGSIDKVNTLQEFFGYCLTKDTRKEKALLLLGESRTGKSTILQGLRHIVGDDNCSFVALKYISHPQYTPMLINKLINIDTEVSGNALDFERDFKTITSGEPVNCNQKFVETFKFNPFCKMVMSANVFPRITDHSSAFYKRLIIIPCDRVFEENEQNINLKDELLKELSGILNWAIDGLHRLNERGRFEQKDFMKDAVNDLREESNPVETFFKDHIITDVSGGIEIEKGELYQYYREWST